MRSLVEAELFTSRIIHRPSGRFKRSFEHTRTASPPSNNGVVVNGGVFPYELESVTLSRAKSSILVRFSPSVGHSATTFNLNLSFSGADPYGAGAHPFHHQARRRCQERHR